MLPLTVEFSREYTAAACGMGDRSAMVLLPKAKGKARALETHP
jgi:hypothetical protein